MAAVAQSRSRRRGRRLRGSGAGGAGTSVLRRALFDRTLRTKGPRVKRFLLLLTVITSILAVAFGPTSFAADGPNAGAPQAVPAEAGAAPAVTRVHNFSDADQVFVYDVVLSGGTVFAADTLDCCVKGDRWGLTVVNTTPATPKIVSKCGNGKTDARSGKVQLGSSSKPLRDGALQVLVFYCKGVDQFPAGMDVQFRYDGQMTVTESTFNPPDPA